MHHIFWALGTFQARSKRLSSSRFPVSSSVQCNGSLFLEMKLTTEMNASIIPSRGIYLYISQGINCICMWRSMIPHEPKCSGGNILMDAPLVLKFLLNSAYLIDFMDWFFARTWMSLDVNRRRSLRSWRSFQKDYIYKKYKRYFSVKIIIFTDVDRARRELYETPRGPAMSERPRECMIRNGYGHSTLLAIKIKW